MREGPTNDHLKEWAKLLYTRHDKAVKDIALEMNVDEVQVRNWVMNGAWDGMRWFLLISKDVQLQNLYSLLEVLNNKMKCAEEVSVKDVDLMVKYTAAIGNLEAQTTVAMIIEVAELFVNWLRRKDLELTKMVTLLLDEFIKQRSSLLTT